MSERMTKLLNALSEARKNITSYGYTTGRTTDSKMKHLEDLFTRAANAVVDEWRAELFREKFSRVPAAIEREVVVGPAKMPKGTFICRHLDGRVEATKQYDEWGLDAGWQAIQIEFPTPPAPPEPAPNMEVTSRDGTVHRIHIAKGENAMTQLEALNWSRARWLDDAETKEPTQ